MDQQEKEFIYKRLHFLKEEVDSLTRTIERLVESQDKMVETMEKMSEELIRRSSPEYHYKMSKTAEAYEVMISNDINKS